MSVMSNMQITLREGVRAEAVATFIKLSVFEECAKTIPGFLWARLLEVEGAPERIAVISVWSDQSAFDDWVAHPIRAKQESLLMHYLAEPPQTELYRTRAGYERTPSSLQ